MSFKDHIGLTEEFGCNTLNGEVFIAGHTNKNWHGLKKDITDIVKDTSIPDVVDQTEEKNKGKESRNTDE